MDIDHGTTPESVERQRERSREEAIDSAEEEEEHDDEQPSTSPVKLKKRRQIMVKLGIRLIETDDESASDSTSTPQISQFKASTILRRRSLGQDVVVAMSSDEGEVF